MLTDLIELAHSLENYVVSMEGNISKKNSDGSFYIKKSGSFLAALTENDLILCDCDGNKIDSSNKKPSMEVGMHAWLYQNLNCNVIAHTHPTNTLKILCSDKIEEFASVRFFPDHVVFNGKKSCIVPYANPGLELKSTLEKATKKFIMTTNEIPNIFLLQNHGIITIGQNHTECLVATEICEKAAEIYLGSKLLGLINTLSLKDIEYISKDKNEIYRKGQL
jgi:L-fuculose-phosphate aldolase